MITTSPITDPTIAVKLLRVRPMNQNFARVNQNQLKPASLDVFLGDVSTCVQFFPYSFQTLRNTGDRQSFRVNNQRERKVVEAGGR